MMYKNNAKSLKSDFFSAFTFNFNAAENWKKNRQIETMFSILFNLFPPICRVVILVDGVAFKN